MLIELSIKNFAIIESLTVSFEKGLTVLTGETGAGKSIIIDALSLLVGGRGSSEFVRHGNSRAEIQGLFYIYNQSHAIYERAQHYGIEIDDDATVVFERSITHQGKSICRINGKIVTLTILRELGSLLVDIHGQHEHQHLMQAEKHLSLLDQFSGEAIFPTLVNYRRKYEEYIKINEQVKQFTENEQKLAHRLDLLQYQLSEIQQAKLMQEEDISLVAERYKLNNREKLYKTVVESYNSLYGEGHGLDYLLKAMNHVEEAAEIDEDLKSLKDTVSNCYYLLEEASYSLRDYYEAIEFDPQRLNIIEARLNEINQLKRKYGDNVSEILQYAAKIEVEIDSLINRDEKITQLQKQLEKVKGELFAEAEKLSSLRKAAAKQLANSIHQQLKDLFMKNTVFDVSFKQDHHNQKDNVRFTADGIDKVEFLLSTNPGEPLKPLAKIASGGEISRIMLALKTIFSNRQGITSLIFDEVDTGVSGRVAQAIAEKIFHISLQSQVLCITHLPQVAAMANTHLFIEKKQSKTTTITTVTPLLQNDQVEELARMLSGATTTKLTRDHANELLRQAEEIKNNYLKS